MSTKSSRRDHLNEILNGTSPDLLPLDQGSALVQLLVEDSAEAQSQNIFLSLIIPVVLIFGMAAILFSIQNNVKSPLLQLGEVGLLVLLFVWLWIQSSRRQKRIRSLAVSVQSAIEELDNTQKKIQKYMYDLDVRTSKYFHCVTNTKITAYFVLLQMSSALAERVINVREVFASGVSRVASALEALRVPLEFSDGALPTSGTIHSLPLSRVGKTADLLIDLLEQGIKELEDEIRNWEKSQSS